jgi:predicted transposase YdaD
MKHAIELMLEERDKDVLKQNKLEIAKNLLNEGMKTDKVAEITGLMIDDILRLQS